MQAFHFLFEAHFVPAKFLVPLGRRRRIAAGKVLWWGELRICDAGNLMYLLRKIEHQNMYVGGSKPTNL